MQSKKCQEHFFTQARRGKNRDVFDNPSSQTFLYANHKSIASGIDIMAVRDGAKQLWVRIFCLEQKFDAESADQLKASLTPYFLIAMIHHQLFLLQ
jgi:hypothetical protein